MPSIAVTANPDQMAVSEADRAEMKAVRLKRRIFELISNVGLLRDTMGGGLWETGAALGAWWPDSVVNSCRA